MVTGCIQSYMSSGVLHQPGPLKAGLPKAPRKGGGGLHSITQHGDKECSKREEVGESGWEAPGFS